MLIYKLVAAIMLLSASSVFADAIDNLNSANDNQQDSQGNTKYHSVIDSKSKEPEISFSKDLIENKKPIASGNINHANDNPQDYQQNTKAHSTIYGRNQESEPSFSKGLFENQIPSSSTTGDRRKLTKTLAELPTTQSENLWSDCQIRFLLGLNNAPQKGRISGFLLGAGGNSSSTMSLSPIIMSQNLRFGIPLSFDTDKSCWRMFVPQSFSIETALQKKLKAAAHNKRIIYILRHK